MRDKNEQAIEIYDAVAEKYAQTFDAIDADEDLKFLNRFLTHLKSGSSVIDLGCGTGFTTEFFWKKGMKPQGIDLSEGMISIARRKYPDRPFIVADMREFEPAEPVDAIWAGYSLFHFEERYLDQTIGKVKGYLNLEGIFGLVVQEGTGEVEMPEPFLPEKSIYIHLYTEKELEDIFASHGFEMIDRDRKEAKEYEFPFGKLLLIFRRVRG